MSEWKEYKLGKAPIEIIDGDRGHNYPKQNEFMDKGYCLFLSTKNVREKGFLFSDCQFISKEKDNILHKGKLQRQDIVLTTRGTVGNLGYYDENVKYDNIRINSGMVIIRPNPNKIAPSFCFYLFRQLQRHFSSHISGSAQPQLPVKDLKEIKILLPSLAEQKQIANLLSSLDNKIDLLNRQNQTLESMAETLFRHYFIDNAKPEWEEGTIANICHFTKEKIKIEDIEINTYISTENMLPNKIGISLASSIPQIGTAIKYHRNNVLISNIRPYFKKIWLANGNGSCSNDILCFQSHNLLFENLLYYTLRQDVFFDYIMLGSKGCKMPRGDKEHIMNWPLCIPDAHSINKFNSQIKLLINKKRENERQICTLTKLRDTLLPKLMNGEVII